MTTTTVTSKGQVTIPKAVRDLLRIAPGSKVDFQRAADGQHWPHRPQVGGCRVVATSTKPTSPSRRMSSRNPLMI
ncbi:AbrB/MazE/SpoVT family DNA-binding domain-containing protein [Neorhizobium galegae]|uniref:AbrB/MazE/SpoVT family DNA-binding domain-containing protein n=1 Tax=Neorhizobium galegae TaxID=399 RepID=UPI0009B973D3